MIRYLAYDVSNDAARDKLAAVVLGYGERIQRSVYRCRADELQVHQMLSQALAIIDHGRDVVHVLSLCGACADRVVAVGAVDPEVGSPCWIV